MRFNDGKRNAKRKDFEKKRLTKDQMDKHLQFKTEGKYRREWKHSNS